MESNSISLALTNDASNDEVVPGPTVEKKRSCGKLVNSIWVLFTDAIGAHQVSSGNNHACKHCKQSVRHHNKTLSVQTHLRKFRPFMKVMQDTMVEDCPVWWGTNTGKRRHSATSSTSNSTNSTLVSLLRSPQQAQASITNYGSPKLTKGQLGALHESLAMHFFCTGTSFQQIEDPNLLKAFQIANPSVVLPTRQKLAGPLLDKCFVKVKQEVDKVLSFKTQYLCITSDGWSNIANEAVVNYMAVSPSHSLFVESINTADQGHNADWIAADLQRGVSMDSLKCNVAGAVTDKTTTDKEAW